MTADPTTFSIEVSLLRAQIGKDVQAACRRFREATDTYPTELRIKISERSYQGLLAEVVDVRMYAGGPPEAG